MKNADSDRVTLGQVQRLLTAVGFVGSTRDDGSLVYYHSQSGSLLVLPATRGNHAVRQVDILSVGRHLVGQGHLEEDEFAAFVHSGLSSK